MTHDDPTVLDSVEFRRRLGVDRRTAAMLCRASGGRFELGRAAWLTACRMETGMDELLESSGLTEVAVAGVHLDLELAESDAHVFETLSLLPAFSETAAAVAVEAVAGSDDPQSQVAIIRLRLAGLVHAGERTGTLMVPPLLSAWCRSQPPRSRIASEPRQDPEPGGTTTGHDAHRTAWEAMRRTIVEAFLEHIESAPVSDGVLIDDALILARRARLWRALARIASAVGLPLLYRHPEAAVAAYAHLPHSALREEPGLVTLSDIADTLAEALNRTPATGILSGTRPSEPGSGLSPAQAREIVARATGPGSRICAEPSGPEPADATRFSSGPSRPRAVARLRAAIAAVRSGEPGWALALLRDVEDGVRETAVGGDFLAPAVAAWSAFAAYLIGDHRRAETALLEFGRLDAPPLVVEAAFRPPALVVAAHLARDRLDLSRLGDLLERMKRFSEMGALWIHVPVLERSLALLAAPAASGILLADEAAEVYARSRATDGSEEVLASRAETLIGLGQVPRAERLVAQLSPVTGAKHVLRARSEVISGRQAEALATIRTHFYHGSLTPRQRAELAGLKAVSLLRLGQEGEADAAFREAIELSGWVGSLLPIALLPAPDRRALLERAPDATLAALQEVTGTRTSAAELRDLLGAVAGAMVPAVESPTLTQRERTLLGLLDEGCSVAQIAASLHLVEGTVKNGLSALYRKLGATGRDSALARAHSLGCLEPARAAR